MNWSCDELSANANGGTELSKRALWNLLTEEERNSVNIIATRVRDVDENKPNILWIHDLAGDSEVQHLRYPQSRERFAATVFVSFWQQQQFKDKLDFPFGEGLVIKNAIEPIPDHVKPDDGIVNLIYHTTPHRGLELLVPIFDWVYRNVTKSIHLDVYSSFNAYGWPERDEQYEPVFQACRDHPAITYHGFQPNATIRQALQKAHIFAYPNIWQETSCIAMIEALSARCSVLVPRYGALPETGYDFPYYYSWTEDPQTHAMKHAKILGELVRAHLEPQFKPVIEQQSFIQKEVVDASYAWKRRIGDWRKLVRTVTETARR